MLYLFVTISNYKQLKKINQDLVSDIRNNIDRIVEISGIAEVYDRDENILFILGEEHKLEPQKMIEFAFKINHELQNKQEELFGFNLIMALFEEHNLRIVEKYMKDALLIIEDDEEIWLEEKAWQFFSGTIESRKVGDFWIALRKDISPKATRAKRKPLWYRENVVRKVVKTITDQYEDKEDSRGILITGLVPFERKFLIDAVQHRLFEQTLISSAPRLFTLFRRRSAIHPLLNSIDPHFLMKIPEYLNGYELKVWKDLGDLLGYLKPPAGGATASLPLSLRRDPQRRFPNGSQDLPKGVTGDPPQRICPDHLYEDFYIAYQLYLSAYFRMMEENFLPAVLICEDVDTYHPDSLKALHLLFRDFYQNPLFIPVFTSVEKKLPKEFEFLNIHTISLHPLGPKKIYRFSAAFFPGLNIPGVDCQKLRQATKGMLIPLFHTLIYLKSKGKIGEDSGQYHWNRFDKRKKVFPNHPLAVSWYVVTTLPYALKHLLYIIYLQAGLLDRSRLIALLESLGIPEEASNQSLEELIEYGLIHSGDCVIPLFPAFRNRLRKSILKADPNLEEKFVGYLIKIWREEKFPNLVLLFFLLRKAKQMKNALEVFAQLLKQKLDELNFEGIQTLLKQNRLDPTSASSPFEQDELKLLLKSMNLRFKLLTRNIKDAEVLYFEAKDYCNGCQTYPVSKRRGNLTLQIARFFEMKGETDLSLEWAKKSLIQFQNSDFVQGERLATIELGAIMLAQGKFEEALEYFSFSLSEQFPAKSVSLEVLRAFALRSVTLFMTGNLSLARSEARKCLILAGSIKRREWELFMIFLEARILFELGSYHEAVRAFQEGLAVERLYSCSKSTKKVLYAWLGRSYAYLGQIGTAIGILSEIEECSEKNFMLGEAYFFNGRYSKALEVCDRAISLDHSIECFPCERILWANGWAAVEGNCFSLLKNNALHIRLIQSFQSYLWGLEGNVERGIEQLYSITRGEKLPETDPYLSIYHYLYAGTLPEERNAELDDNITILNKALKCLQQRASRIEDSKIRWQFLHRNFWNASLLEEAQKKNLL